MKSVTQKNALNEGFFCLEISGEGQELVLIDSENRSTSHHSIESIRIS